MIHFHIQIFSDYLQQLDDLLNKIESHVEGDQTILESRLSPDMFPLFTQVEIAANFSLRTCCPIAKQSLVSFVQPQRTFTGLHRQLNNTLAHLQCLDNIESDLSIGTLTDMAGPAQVTLPTMAFLHRFALPNFYFHISMVYAIAKANGIPVSKGDYDGFHTYPVGFSFAD